MKRGDLVAGKTYTILNSSRGTSELLLVLKVYEVHPKVPVFDGLRSNGKVLQYCLQEAYLKVTGCE